MKCGRTENGVVYPYGVVSNAAYEFMKKPYRPVFIEGTNVTCNDLSQLAGVVNSMEIDDNVLYADITPGTPGIYRREALRKLYLTGYKVTGLAMWGCDLNINDYEVKYARWHLDRDNEILAEIEREYRTAAVDRRWLPDLTDIRTPLFGGAVWRAFNGLDNGSAS